MRPEWEAVGPGCWEWRGLEGAGLVEVHPHHVEWYVATLGGEERAEGWVAIDYRLEERGFDPEAVALAAAAGYAEAELGAVVPSVLEDEDLRYRVWGVTLRPVPEWHVRAMLCGGEAMVDVTGWYARALAAGAGGLAGCWGGGLVPGQARGGA